MKLSNIAEAIGGKMRGLDVEVKGISRDSRSEQKNNLFICLKGRNVNSHEYITEAINNGAVAVLSEKILDVDIPYILVSDSRRAYAEACAVFFGNPQKKMKIVAVTGTNGKTTTAFLLKEIFTKAGLKAGYMGTLFVEYGDVRVEATLTTPDPEVLFKHLSEMYSKGVKYVFIEASAHSLFLKKLDSITFDAAILTNVTRDHLDFFNDITKYIDAKKSLFKENRTKLAIINADDKVGFDLLKNAEVATVSYGIHNPSDVFAVDIEKSDGLSFAVNMYDVVFGLHTDLSGVFNVYNILAACAYAGYVGIKPDIIQSALQNVEVPGRFNVYEKNGVKAVIDYAHTPDGLKKLLLAALDMNCRRLITVFGCGGNRDKGKREEMGAVATAYSDYIIITNDNPRYEDQLQIANDIESGASFFENLEIILDREEAIKRAVSIAGRGDVIVIAGKGDEKYMEINGKKLPFDDKQVLCKYLK